MSADEPERPIQEVVEPFSLHIHGFVTAYVRTQYVFRGVAGYCRSKIAETITTHLHGFSWVSPCPRTRYPRRWMPPGRPGKESSACRL